MTSLKSSPIGSHSAVGPPDGRQKDVLFCPTCSHESPIDGDWLVETESETVSCPECETVLGAQ